MVKKIFIPDQPEFNTEHAKTIKRQEQQRRNATIQLFVMIGVVAGGFAWVVSLKGRKEKKDIQTKILNEYSSYNAFKIEFPGFNDLSDQSKERIRKLFNEEKILSTDKR